jgi:hypothetical protein
MLSSTGGGGEAVLEPPPQLLSKGTVSSAESTTASRRETILRSPDNVFIIFRCQLVFAKNLAVAEIELELLLFLQGLKKRLPLIYNSADTVFCYSDLIFQPFHPAFEINTIHPKEISS